MNAPGMENIYVLGKETCVDIIFRDSVNGSSLNAKQGYLQLSYYL